MNLDANSIVDHWLVYIRHVATRLFLCFLPSLSCTILLTPFSVSLFLSPFCMMDSDITHDNYSAWTDSCIAQDWFRPMDSFFNDRTPCLSLILSPGPRTHSIPDSVIDSLSITTQSPLIAFQSPAGDHKASGSSAGIFGALLPPPSASDPPRPLPATCALSNDRVLKLLEMGTSNLFLTLFQYGYLAATTVNGYYALECPHCNNRVKTSIPSTTALSSSGQFNALTNHYCRKACISASTHNDRETTSMYLQTISSSSLSHRSSTPSLITRQTSVDSET